jgi:shikimate dehydrogenase
VRRLYGLLGDPVAHSRSPRIHARAFSLLEVDAVYAPFHVTKAALDAAFQGLRALSVAGFNVTVPHKREAFGRVDRHAPSALRSGSVNCVLRDRDSLVGHDTDGDGLLRALAALSLDTRGQRAVVLGAGGSGAACATALSFAGAKVTLVNRSPGQPRRVAASLNSQGVMLETAPLLDGAGALSGDARSALAAAAIVVHCTTVGLGTQDALFSPAALGPGAALVDLVYAGGPGSRPGETALVMGARQRKGLMVIDGLDVLVHQALASLEIWLSRAPSALAELFPELRRVAAEEP